VVHGRRVVHPGSLQVYQSKSANAFSPALLQTGMQTDLVEILCCPVDKHDLELAIDEQDDDEVLAGTLTCTECGEAYPIEDGIPNLLPPDMRDETPA
jgi:uncharacterized protein YbaR (Trm112 family)